MKRNQKTLIPTLPAWCYNNKWMFNTELESIFPGSWQFVCHQNDIPKSGDFYTFNLPTDKALVIRGNDGSIRAFHNVCRHRAHAVVNGRKGQCRGAIRCPYHGWTYALDGKLKVIPTESGFGDIDKNAFGLNAIEVEVFHGLVFVRFRTGGASVSKILSAYSDEFKNHRVAEMKPSQPLVEYSISADWKNLMDNFQENYHIPTGHPGLHDLLQAPDSDDEEYTPDPNHIIDSASGVVQLKNPEDAKKWSNRHYLAFLPSAEHLPEKLRRTWTYYTIFPNNAFGIYPDMMDFFQILPLAPGRSVIRTAGYALPDQRRTMKLTRYLNGRINRMVQREDDTLVLSVQKGLESNGYPGGVLSRREAGVVEFHDWLRKQIPQYKETQPPQT